MTTKIKRKIIFIAGLPKAGKSLLCGGLYNVLRKEGRSFFIERLSPDSEGQWTFESGELDRAREIKTRLKERGEFFSPAFVEAKVRAIVNMSRVFNLLILDMGGIPSRENAAFVQAALSCPGADIEAWVLVKEGREPQEWLQFFQARKIKTRVIETRWVFDDTLKQQAEELAKAVIGRV